MSQEFVKINVQTTHQGTLPVALVQASVADALAVTLAESRVAFVVAGIAANSHGNQGNRMLREVASLPKVSLSDL